MPKRRRGGTLMMIGWAALMFGGSAADSPAPGHWYAAAIVLLGCLAMLTGVKLEERAGEEW